MLPTSSYNQPSRNAGRLLNCYAIAGTAKGPVEIVGTPGVSTFRTLTGGGRGLAVQDGVLYALAGTSLYRVSDGAPVGEIPGTASVMFAPGVTQLVTDNGYIFDGSVSQITDADKPAWSAVDFVDGYVVYVESDSGRFGASALNDASDYSALDYATAEGSPDKLVTLKVDHRQVALFGTDSVEIWWNSGQAGFPFERVASGYIEIGCLARLGVTKADNSLFWLASDRTIRRLSGSTPVKVSQIGVEEKLASYATVSDCEAYSFTWNGTVHVCFRFVSQGITWCYSVNSGEWWESDADWVTAIHHDGKVWIQSTDGSVGYLTDDVYTHFGANVIREVTFPNIAKGEERLFHSRFRAIFRTGDVDPGITPMVQLDISDDGGNQWVQLPPRSMGLTGKYRHVVEWHRLGAARDRCYRLRVSDAVPFYLVGAEAS